MIRVIIRKDDTGAYRSFVCTGHADYAAEGADIVCAGVSGIVINTVNCITDLLHEELTIDLHEREGGYIAVSFKNRPSEKAVFLIDCMIYGFDWIIGQYGKRYLKYEIKEAEKC